MRGDEERNPSAADVDPMKRIKKCVGDRMDGVTEVLIIRIYGI